MAIKNAIEVKQPTEIPEVEDYMDMLETWDRFKKDTTIYSTTVASVMERAYQYVEQLEALRDQADKAVRAAGCSCGPFELNSSTLKIDWDKIHAFRGREGFLKVGGVIKTQNTCKGDINRYLAAKAQGFITPEEASEYEGNDAKFKVIKPYNLP